MSYQTRHLSYSRFIRWTLSQKAPTILRTYRASSVNKGLHPIVHSMRDDRAEIWEICRATTAAPTFFYPKQMEIHEFNGDNDETTTLKGHGSYFDGGFGTNNPTEISYNEVKSHSEPGEDVVVVSIGTGIHKKRFSSILGTSWNQRYLTDTENVHKAMHDKFNERCDQHMECRNGGGCLRNRYFRFNVKKGLGELPMDKCDERQPVKTFAKIDKFVGDEYPDGDSDNNKKLEELAKILVTNRQNRAGQPGADGARWRRFEEAIHFHCSCAPECMSRSGDFMSEEVCRKIKEGTVHRFGNHQCNHGESRQEVGQPEGAVRSCNPHYASGPW